MNAWIVYTVGISQIVVLYFLALPYCLDMTYKTYLGKNRQWVHDNVEFRERYPSPQYSRWLSYFIGVICLAFVFYLLSAGDESRHVKLLTWSMFPFSVLYSCHALVDYYRMYRKIPLPQRRSVILQRRSLRDLVNLRWVYCGYSLVALATAGYVFAYVNEQINVNELSKRMLGLALGALIATFGLIYSVRRKKQAFDEACGPSYRKGEAAVAIAGLYLFAVGGVVVAAQDLFALNKLAGVESAVLLSVLVQAALLYMGSCSRPKDTQPPNSPLPSAHG